MSLADLGWWRSHVDAKPTLVLGSLGALLVAGTFVLPPLHRAYGSGVWLPVMLAWTAVVAIALWLASRPAKRHTMLIILGGAAVMRLAMLLSPPYLSSDVYRYVWDGRVQAAGINPYRYIPAAHELAALRDTAIYPNINRADYAPTIYPPAAQGLFLVAHMFGDGERTMRTFLLAFDALTIAALMGILRALSQPVTRVVAYAWHPLPLWEIACNGHVDAAMLGLLSAGFLFFLLGKPLRASVLVALAALVKPTALLAMPVMWKPWDWKLPAVLVGTVAAAYLPYLSAGSQVFGFLGGYLKEEKLADGGGFRYVALIEQAIGQVPGLASAYIVVACAILVALALRAGFRSDRSAEASMQALSVLLIAFMVLLTPHYPWYYLVLVPLLATSGMLAPWVITAGGFVLYNDTGTMWRETLFHLTVLAALIYDCWRARWWPSMIFKNSEVKP